MLIAIIVFLLLLILCSHWDNRIWRLGDCGDLDPFFSTCMFICILLSFCVISDRLVLGPDRPPSGRTVRSCVVGPSDHSCVGYKSRDVSWIGRDIIYNTETDGLWCIMHMMIIIFGWTNITAYFRLNWYMTVKFYDTAMSPVVNRMDFWFELQWRYTFCRYNFYLMLLI